MKSIVKFITLTTMILIGNCVFAQNEVSQMYGAGVAYGVNASPAIAGDGFYAKQISDSNTYAYTNFIAIPNTIKPLTITSNVGVGVAQKVALIGKVPIYSPVSVGPSWTGTNFGYQYSGGFLAAIHLKNDYFFLPSVRFNKSSVSNGTGYQVSIGFDFGWGK